MFINNEHSFLEMSLSELFSKTNLRILELLNEQEHHIREIADELDISPSKAHQAVGLFKELGLVETRKKKNRTIVSLNYDSLLLDEILEIVDTYNYIKRGPYEVVREVNHGKG